MRLVQGRATGEHRQTESEFCALNKYSGPSVFIYQDTIFGYVSGETTTQMKAAAQGTTVECRTLNWECQWRGQLNLSSTLPTGKSRFSVTNSPQPPTSSCKRSCYSTCHTVKPTYHTPWKLMRDISGDLGWVRSIAVKPDNKWFATSAGEHIIKSWNLTSGELRRRSPDISLPYVGLRCHPAICISSRVVRIRCVLFSGSP